MTDDLTDKEFKFFMDKNYPNYKKESKMEENKYTINYGEHELTLTYKQYKKLVKINRLYEEMRQVASELYNEIDMHIGIEYIGTNNILTNLKINPGMFSSITIEQAIDKFRKVII